MPRPKNGLKIKIEDLPHEFRQTPILTFHSQAEFLKWLKRNHQQKESVWVRFFSLAARKVEGFPFTLTYPEALDAALCWGWIDGQIQKVDPHSSVRRFSPRRPRSLWSQINCGHVERLCKEGKMQPPGLLAVEAAKKDGRWEKAYLPVSKAKIPKDLQSWIDQQSASVKEYVQQLKRSAINSIFYRLETAKTPETRARRLAAIQKELLLAHPSPGRTRKVLKASIIISLIGLTSLLQLSNATSREGSPGSHLEPVVTPMVQPLPFQDSLPLSVSDPQTSATPDDIFYEIFVRSYQDSGSDGVGDLKGISQRLAYLKRLGITGIWLTPIYPSPSYHGYDVTDDRSIRAKYGDFSDLDQLLATAHQLGIKVVLDWVVNHTSDQHPVFIDPVLTKKHYVWRQQPPNWPGPTRWFRANDSYYFATFDRTLPDLNFQNSEVVTNLRETANFWLRRGIDGFRLDAVRHLVEGPNGELDTPMTHAVLTELLGSLRGNYPKQLFVGEVWADLETIIPYLPDSSRNRLLLANGLTDAFNFPFAFAVREAVTLQQTDKLARLITRLSELPGATLSRLSPFINNHDIDRLSHPSALPLAAAALLTFPGTPYLYYGEEIAMENGRPKKAQDNTCSQEVLPEVLPKALMDETPTDIGARSDLPKRTPMLWDASPGRGFTPSGVTPWIPFSSIDPRTTVAAQEATEGSLLKTYQTLIRIRRENPALQSLGPLFSWPALGPAERGQTSTDAASPLMGSPRQASLISWLRQSPSGPTGEAVFVALNFGSTFTGELRFRLPGKPRPKGRDVRISQLWTNATINFRPIDHQLHVDGMPPYSGLILKLAPSPQE